MFANGYQRIYYHHLPKTGGSSLNSWLDRQVESSRHMSTAWKGLFGDLNETPQRLAKAIFYGTDVVYTHLSIATQAPPNTFCFTILRNPADRIVSQIADWRRLTVEDLAYLPNELASLMRSASALSVRDFLIRAKESELGHLLSDFQARLISMNRLGTQALDLNLDIKQIRETALKSLEVDYQMVAVTERSAEVQNAIAALLGLVPENDGVRLNVTSSKLALEDEVRQAADILDELTTVDRVLYDAAARLFQNRHSTIASSYDMASFESNHSLDGLIRLKPQLNGGDVLFDIRDAVVGQGFHGRDGVGNEDCRLWTGPSGRSFLYMPVPKGEEIVVKLFVFGYAAEHQRDSLYLKVDGILVNHEFIQVNGYREMIKAEVITTRDIICLEIILDQAASSFEDDRLRGISFDRYGWQIKQDVC